ncbi:MAG: HDIG domain-containing protein [Roseiflexaceae bacterium]
MTYTEQADALLREWVESESLRGHCYAVGASMRHFARLNNADEDLWNAIGILHDMDYERHPNLEHREDAHPFVGVAYLRQHGWSEEVCRAILSHADYSGVPRESTLEKTLAAVDELSGFVMAVARVKPNKSLDEVDVASVRKKLKDKAFARAVNRDEITHNAEALGMPLDELIGHVIQALRADATRLGLAGGS